MPDNKSPAASEDEPGKTSDQSHITRSDSDLNTYARQARERWERDHPQDTPPDAAEDTLHTRSTTHDLKREAARALHMQFQAQQTRQQADTSPDENDDAPASIVCYLESDDQQSSLQVIVSDSALIVGRSDPRTRYQPDVDLTPYGAYRLGISRRHATLTQQNAHLCLTDSGSRNGTAINGQALTPKEAYPLQDGDTLRFGQLYLTLRLPAPE